jgi:hypothetical protein
MKHSTFASLAFLAVALCAAVPASHVLASTAQEGRPQQPGGQEGGARQGSPLGGHMRTLDEGVDKLTAALDADDAEAKIDELVAEVCRLQQVSLDAKGEAPRSMGRLEDKDKQKALVSYRTQMQNLTSALFAVELQLLAKDIKKAKKALNELTQIQAKGHGEFKKGGGGRGR